VLLAHAIDVRRWLRDDRATPAARRLQRDRDLGRRLTTDDPSARVLGWWSLLAAEGHRADGNAASAGARVVVARRAASVGLLLLGFGVGASVAGVALAYDGRHPVNLFTLLGVLVALPGLMLAFTLLLLPGRLPGLGGLQSLAAGMSAGRWLGAWLDRWLDVDLFVPRGAAAAAMGRFSRWQVVVFSQWLAVGFFAGALLVMVLLVTFTDLAFGWSSTLDIEVARVQGAVTALAAPWAAWLPAAAPDAALVEASRYFRLDDGGPVGGDVSRLGAWWPFVLMTVLFYGALPRLLLLAFGAWRLRRATTAMLLDDPEVAALLDRLRSPLLAIEGSGEEEVVDAAREALPAPRDLPAGEGLAMLLWNAAADSGTARAWLADHLGVQPAAEASLGILQDESRQRALLDGLADALRGRLRRVLIITKGWEPPLLEFNDFLGLVREVLGGDCSITVVPLALDGGRVDARDRDVWARALARVRDPRLYVQEADDEPPARQRVGE
jgi:hypothetical protein